MSNDFSQQPFQQQNLQQTQQLTPSQLQGLHVLSVPVLELEAVINNELELNPLLEVLNQPHEELAGDPLADATAAVNEISASEFDGDREEFPILQQLSDIWQESSFSGDEISAEDSADMQKKRDFQFESLVTARTLVDILFEQLDFFTLTKRQRRAAELVIGSLDERGFLTTHAADIAMAGDLSLDEVEDAVKLVQSFDPPGVAARDTVEALILQLQRRNYPDERIYTLLKEHRDELERNHLPRIAKAMNISIDEVYSMLAELKKLNFIPAAGLESSTRTVHVVPEMSIELENNLLTVNSSSNTLPRLGIVQQYLKLLEDPQTPEETRQYLREKLSNAENLLKSLELRQNTLTRITNVIAVRQADFFRHGIAYLQPMTMAEVAKELDLHETTISRAVANKYLDTPQGVKEYRFFFSGGYKNASGEDVSSRGVKELIRQLIADEDPRKPLSDAAIAQKLAEQGLDVARRTVAKYRESMDILPTNLRRKH